MVLYLPAGIKNFQYAGDLDALPKDSVVMNHSWFISIFD